MAKFKMAAIIKLSENECVLSQIELVWVRVRLEWECFWENLREDTKVSESKMAVSESNMAEYKMAAIIKLSENECVWRIELVWVKWVKCEWECLQWMVGDQTWQGEWEEKMADDLNPKMAEFKMAAISTWVRMNEFESDGGNQIWVIIRVRVFWVNLREAYQGVWIQDGRIQDGCHHQVESEWMSEVFLCKWWEPKNEWNEQMKFFFCANGGNQSWQVWVSLRGKTKMAWIQDGRIQDGRIQDGRIQDGCHHQVKWEWMSLSQIKLVWVRVRLEWECFWVNLREDTKVSESKMAEFKMAAIIKLSLPSSSWVNQWMSEVFFCANGGNQSWQVWGQFERKN